MPRIKLIPDSKDAARPKYVSKSGGLVEEVNRFRPPGGKPPLAIDKVYNRQDGKSGERY